MCKYPNLSNTYLENLAFQSLNIWNKTIIGLFKHKLLKWGWRDGSEIECMSLFQRSYVQMPASTWGSLQLLEFQFQ